VNTVGRLIAAAMVLIAGLLAMAAMPGEAS